MKRLTIIAALFAAPVGAAPLATWSGAGPNACNGGCTFEETASQISPEFQEQWRAAQQDQPEPVELFVQDGAVFLASTYFVDGQQKVTKNHTVATLDQPEPAVGWVLADGSMFVKLDDCTNPTHVDGSRSVDTTGVPRPYAARSSGVAGVRMASNGFSAFTGGVTGSAGVVDTPGLIFDEEVAVTTPVVDDPAPVPAPASWILLLCVLLAFVIKHD